MAEYILPELSEAQPPIWLRHAWAGAEQRGVDHLTRDEINAEIAPQEVPRLTIRALYRHQAPVKT
jgi:hypothetical protein